ncbi:TPA: hypothetical protein ACT2FU_002258, partial [Streptococcus suis]
KTTLPARQSKKETLINQRFFINYTGGRGRTGTSLRTLDFEFGTQSFNGVKTDKIGIISNYFYQKNGRFFYF